MAQPTVKLHRWLDNDQYAATYIIFTRSQRTGADVPDRLLPEQLAAIEQALIESPDFEIYYQNRDATILTLAPPAGE
jgi:hypothetical protein